MACRPLDTRADRCPPASLVGKEHLVAQEHSGKAIVSVIVVLVAAVALYFALGMPGMDHGTGASMAGMDMAASSGPHRLVGPREFETLLEDPSATVVNVHVPYDGQIKDTDLLVPFDAIDASVLPADRAGALLVYCRSGNMSAIASTTLVELGYTNVVELGGGMQAWTESGRPLIYGG